MNTVIGLAVASDELRSVAVRDGMVRWAMRADRTSEPALAVQIAALLAQAPSPRWRKSRVIAVIGPGAAQMKRLAGLPPIESRAALGALVHESVSRFFLRNGVPLVTSSVRMVELGTVWAAAFEQPVISEIELGCRAAGLDLRAIVPAVDALAAGLLEGRAVWRDGDVRAEIVLQRGAVMSVRRLPEEIEADAEPPPLTVDALSSLGEDAWRFADAYGGAVGNSADGVAFRPGANSEIAVSRRRLLTAAIACAAAALLAIAVPGAAAAIDHAHASRQLAVVAPRARDAAVVEQDLRRMTRALAQVASFENAQRSPVALLGELTRTLPPGAALITLRMDSTGGTLVLLAPRAARAIAALDSVAGIAAPEVVGPVTKEVAGARELERATVRFHLAPGPQ
jgi:hypothetical protein